MASISYRSTAARRMRFRCLMAGAAGYVDQLLRAGNVEELPIEVPTVFALHINLGTSRALDLTESCLCGHVGSSSSFIDLLHMLWSRIGRSSRGEHGVLASCDDKDLPRG